MAASNLSFISSAETIVLNSYNSASEISSRCMAAFFSVAAALDMTFHTLAIVPSVACSILTSDFTQPWQHLQRVKNAVTPLFFGSIFGVIHPLAGIAMCEPTDKHIALGILSSNQSTHFVTPCSPIHSLSIIEDIAKSHPEVFLEEDIQAISSAKSYEASLESLQAQEYIQKITNMTLFVMAMVLENIHKANIKEDLKPVLERVSGILIPVLACLDFTINLIAQAFFLTTGVIRIFTGRGPIYTEATTNPLMQINFFIQNVLKTLGTLLGTLVWFIDPLKGFEYSLIPSTYYFKAEMALLMLKVRLEMFFAKENSKFIIPIAFNVGTSGTLSMPTHSAHKTYLVAQKTHGRFNLYWANRPSVFSRENLSREDALSQIRQMFDTRFPFMDPEKLMEYPVQSDAIEFNGELFQTLPAQGNITNCVVSNLFGALETLDRIRGTSPEHTLLRNQVVRDALKKRYHFYQNGFACFTPNINQFFDENSTNTSI